MNRQRIPLVLSFLAGAAVALPFTPARPPRTVVSHTAEPTATARLSLDGQRLEARVLKERASRSARPSPPPVRPTTRAVGDTIPPVSDRRAPAGAVRSESPVKPARRVPSDARRTPRKPRPAAPRATVQRGGTDLGTVDITAYCWTGNRNAAGRWPRLGEVATLSRRIKFGTRLHIEGLGIFVVADRIGHSSEVDIYMGREGCRASAMQFGRRRLRVVIVP